MDLLPILRDHQNRYPCMTLQDAILLLYQSVFGSNPGCLDAQDSLSCSDIVYKMARTAPNHVPFLEPIGNGRCRLHLNSMENHLRPQTILGLLRSQTPCCNAKKEEFEQELSSIVSWYVEQGFCSKQDAIKQLKSWMDTGYHHSAVFQHTYAPHYCIVEEAWAHDLPILNAIDKKMEKGDLVVAIDGRCASGKSTLSQKLSSIYSCDIVHMDDFFLPPYRKTKERLSEPGGNVDRERFIEQVIRPLKEKCPFSYGIYSCKTGQITPSSKISPSPLVVIEGAYSLHPLHQKNYDLKIFVSCSKDNQIHRILQRNGEEMLPRFVEEWIPMEEAYFSAFFIESCCDICLNTDFLESYPKES